MQIIIQSPHFILDEELNNFVKTKVNRISHLYARIESVSVLLKIEKSDPTDYKVCEVRLSIPGNDLFAKKYSDTFEDAISQATDALKEQIEKMKTRFEHHQ